MGLGEAYALICAFMWASAVILYKYVGDSMSANTLNLVKNLIGLSLLLPTAVIVEGWVLPSLILTDWLILIVSGYAGIAIADTWYLQALRFLGAGRTAVVASLYSPFVVILSLLFLGERLQLWQWLGFALVVMGILVAVYQKHYRSVDGGTLIKGVALAAGSVLLTAAGVVAMKPLLNNNGFFWMVSLRLLAGVAGMFIYLALRGQIQTTVKVVVSGQHRWGSIFVAAVVGTYFAMLFWLAGFKYTDASIASVLNETANVFIILMAWIFLRETLTARKLLGVCLSFIGVVIFLGLLDVSRWLG